MPFTSSRSTSIQLLGFLREHDADFVALLRAHGLECEVTAEHALNRRSSARFAPASPLLSLVLYTACALEPMTSLNSEHRAGRAGEWELLPMAATEHRAQLAGGAGLEHRKQTRSDGGVGSTSLPS
mgnify:CR=1 FL=1